METQNTAEKILAKLIKEPFAEHTATSLAKAFSITRQGLWKTLSKLSKRGFISLESIANIKKSAVNISVQLNPISIKMLSLILTKEAMNNQKWISNFAELEDKVGFLILFGSVLNTPKEAKDIDLIAVLDNKNKFKQVDEIISKIQKTQAKRIHLIDLTKEEFKEELKKQNKAYIDALKKGVILFGQDNFIEFIRSLK
jgi:predicted nucleotidyltransferase/DNA-binding phage protein